ncbi:hypothetical protein B0H12DRAFT_1238908 [Mycena haematopus]|nr:hypothetical protein B0H12DRAFT_1238908 [Mycena haematopus]
MNVSYGFSLLLSSAHAEEIVCSHFDPTFIYGSLANLDAPPTLPRARLRIWLYGRVVLLPRHAQRVPRPVHAGREPWALRMTLNGGVEGWRQRVDEVFGALSLMHTGADHTNTDPETLASICSPDQSERVRAREGVFE